MKHRLISAVILAYMACASTALAQQFRAEWSTESGVSYVATNYGMFGHDVVAGKPGFVCPAGSSQPYLYGAGVYFGALKLVRDTLTPLVVLGYNPNSGASWLTPGEFPGTNVSAGPPILYHSPAYHQSTGIDTFFASNPRWPLWLTPSQTQATTVAPGSFVVDPAERGATSGPFDRPAFMPGVAEQFVARFHDGDLARYEGQDQQGAFPIGLQFQQSIYSWAPDETYGNVVVLQYEVINVSDDTLVDCFIGQGSDPDIGLAANDRVSMYRGTDGKVRAGIAYTMAAGETKTYGALVQVLLESPSVGDNGFVDNSLRSELGTLHEISSFRNWDLTSDPRTIPERYAFLATPQLDSTDTPGDKRTMLAVGPFSMRPGDTAHFAIAYAVYDTLIGRATGDPEPSVMGAFGGIDELIGALVTDYAVTHQFRYAVPSSAARSEAVAAKLGIVPNPASTHATIRFSARGGEAAVVVTNAIGDVVQRTELGAVAPGPGQRTLDVSHLPNGVYVVRVTGADGGATLLTIAR